MSQTPEQTRAADPNASAWVGASAGTGKTFVLTNRVLRLMLSGTPPERLLCLTFTKAAAAEMANRLNDRLAEWAVCDEALLLHQLADLLGGLPDEQTCAKARKLFAEVLDVPGGLKIQTIHSFCQSMLGRFPLEARIAPHFEVIDELTARDYLKQARDVVLGEARAEANPELAEALGHISRRMTEQTFAELIGELVGERGRLERLMGRFRTVNRAILVLRRFLGLSPTESRKDIIAAACDNLAFNEVGLRLVMAALLEGTKTDRARGEAIARWLSDPKGRPDFLVTYMGQFLKQDGEILARLITKKPAEAFPQAETILEAEAERLRLLSQKLRLVEMLENSEALLTIGAAFIGAYRDSKRRHAVLDYDDLILTVTRLLGRADVADWVLFKLDGGIDHILIDEAQDTNPEQWQVIRTLANEFFVGEGARDIPRTIFAVGDVKQSIYSFQRAEPREFVASRQHFAERAAAARLGFHEVSLDLSFRSTQAVLTVVDEVFRASERRLALAFSEAEIAHIAHRTGEAGLVELWPTEQPREVSAPEDWAPPVIQEPSLSAEMRLATRIADKIQDWLDTGEILEARNRPITPGDILILVRHRSKFDDYLIRALKLRGIPVAGQDKMKLLEQLAVMDLMAVGNFVLLPEDDLTLAVVLKSPFVGFSEDDLYALCRGKAPGESLWASLLRRREEKPVFADAAAWLVQLTNAADFAPPFEFYSYLLGPLDGRERLLARLGEEAIDPMDEFLTLAMSYEQNNIPALQGFLSWLESGRLEIKRDMEQGKGEVRIMTVHGAKGLQAPVVILPDTCQRPKKGSKILWVETADGPMMLWPGGAKNELGPARTARDRINQVRDEEYLRLLYVALTRAEDRLYVTGWEGRNGREAGCWYSLIEGAMQTLEGVVETEGWNDQPLRRYECAQTKAETPPPPAAAQERPVEPLPVWARTPPRAEPVPPRPLSPSRPDEEEPAVQSPLRAAARREQDQRRFHRGRLLHRLLEILPELAADKRMAAARRFLSQPAHDLPPEEQDRILNEVRTILEHKEFAPLYGPGSRAEVPLVGVIGTTPVSGQVDRLVITERDIMIVDYKTNRPPPADVTQVPMVYLKQMAAYRRILADLYPDRRVRCALLWTDEARLMELPEERLASIKL
ncbi:double-strand break repair helicase AddA [Luteithermobacter gelatinilyticus]|uniref:double-strand break repair helicase AddA n=1 Tax=Luteithermobacter gelatinilyticus TaxID=2582913 RepID=UPI00110638D9|nr:double-strand break repair helicase AddA [Luteithermobacter gelatinilyticus]